MDTPPQLAAFSRKLHLNRVPMILLNFSHPLSENQRQAVESLIDCKFSTTFNIKTHLDHHAPFPEQVNTLVNEIPLTSTQWQNSRILVVPPSLSIITCILLSNLHGRMGYFPAVLRVKPVPGALPPAFEPAEVVNLQSIRDSSRENR